MGPRGQRRQARAGFSVLEAMIALVITGLALTLIFSIGNRASSGGFNLGRRVLHLADNQIEALSFKALVEGLVVPSGLDKSRTGHGLDAEGQQNLTGSIHALSGSAVLGRDTPCAAAGPAAELSLSLKQTSNHWQLLCRADGGPQRLLMDLGHRAAQFSYSKDGRVWSDAISVAPGTTTSKEFDDRYRPRTVFVRLSTDDQSLIIIERASSGRPRPDLSDEMG